MAGEIKNIYTTATTVISRTTDLSKDNVATPDSEFTNTKNYPRAKATFHAPNGFTGGSWSTATDGPKMVLYGVLTDTDSANDDTPVPTATGNLRNAENFGTIYIDDHSTASTEQRKTIDINLDGVKGANFYLLNSTSRSVDYVSTAITLKILPYTFGPV